MQLLDREFMKGATPEDIKKLLAEGADINARDKKYGATPLHFAILFNKNPEVIDVLLEAGADVSVSCSADIVGTSPVKEMLSIQKSYERKNAK